ncbi:MAG: hypothetical protein ACOC2L_03065 [Candidatus Sumerlaeota bacterium]
MGLLEELFKEKPSEKDLHAKAGETLEQLEVTAQSDPKQALKQLRKRQKDFVPWWRMGGEWHGRFRKVALMALGEDDEKFLLTENDIERLCWNDWDGVTMGDILQKAEASTARALLLDPPDKRYHKHPLIEIEALRAMADSNVVLVVLDEESLLVECEFLRSLAGQVDPKTEEIMQDLTDAAADRGRECATVW